MINVDKCGFKFKPFFCVTPGGMQDQVGRVEQRRPRYGQLGLQTFGQKRLFLEKISRSLWSSVKFDKKKVITVHIGC